MAKIDVIMPTYNQSEFLLRAIPTILEQEFTDFEFFIVNDGSCDKTKSILDEKFSGKDGRLKIIHLEKNSGLPSALNIGHRAGNSEYCTWVSTDNISYKNQLKELYYCITRGNYDFVQSRWYSVKGDEKTPKNILNCKDNWGFGNLCPSFLYKRLVWETYKYDENMLCTEDLKFYLQAFLHPFKFGYSDEYLMEYYVQPNSLTSHRNPKRSARSMLHEIYQTVVLPKIINK